MQGQFGRLSLVIVMVVSLAACFDENKPSAPMGETVRYVIAATQSTSDKQQAATTALLIKLLLKAPLGSEIVIVDGSSAKTVEKIPIDNRASLEVETIRLKQLTPKLLKIKKHFIRTIDPNRKLFLNIPEIMRYTAQLPKTDQRTSIMLIGGPLYWAINDPEHSMLDGHVPSAGHHCLAPQQSPFSLAAVPSKITGASVYLLETGAIPYQNREHQIAVRGFWKTYVGLLGATWALDTADEKSFLANVTGGVPATPTDIEIDCSAEKAEWTTYPRPAEIMPVWMRLDHKVVGSGVRAKPPFGFVKVGIFWKCTTCDFDLHARSRPEARFLHFNLTRSHEGVFFKDYSTNPSIPYGFEFVEFKQPFDLRQLEVLVNFYGGHSSEQDGEFVLRVWFQRQGQIEQVVEQHYQFGATVGNKGAKRGQWQTSPNWIRVDPRALMAE